MIATYLGIGVTLRLYSVRLTVTVYGTLRDGFSLSLVYYIARPGRRITYFSSAVLFYSKSYAKEKERTQSTAPQAGRAARTVYPSRREFDETTSGHGSLSESTLSCDPPPAATSGEPAAVPAPMWMCAYGEPARRGYWLVSRLVDLRFFTSHIR